jgi:hypothetical protein
MVTLLCWTLVMPAHAGGAERTARQHARAEARQLDQLQRTTSRSGVPQEAAARYLERYGHLDTRPVRRVEQWASSLPEAPALETAPSAMPAAATPVGPLALPADPPPPPPPATDPDDAP